ncbi:hypothetical protein QGN23_02295 [Chryseobacterium gotjawalense]|uniref:DUF4177 domain-containing protein n=1 Tax=Chryseobacterium gotjawalense TaxID=3042315 RepID=A0ABY8RE71_9FLAO|nr:hypothetical protein [Chryseobacterium sp. wdc7]WHF52116.1 hypothetical protein QGN23_02295 [Chryseobacterium sp. wdc7]
MQKVITVTTHTNIIDKDAKFTEKEYPQLNAYLEKGYKVKEVVPITLASNTAYMYSLTFILEK